MDIKAHRLEILQQIENGEITLEEASRWLAALDRVQSKNGSHPEEDAGTDPAVEMAAAGEINTAVELTPEPVSVEIQSDETDPQETTSTQTASGSEELQTPFWRGWWLVIFIPGLILLAASVSWMLQGYKAAGLSWGFWLSFIPFTIGVLMTWIGWEVRLARWLHLRIKQKNRPGPSEFNLSLPLPFGLVSWGIRRFGFFSAPLKEKNIEGAWEELNQAVATDGPMHVFVDDNDDQVEIWIDGPRSK